MFESYINSLRLLKRRSSVLNPSDFSHFQTVRDRVSRLAPCSGWSIWISQLESDGVAIVWPWGLIHPGIPAIDPLQIQTNLLLLDDVDRPLPEFLSVAALVHLVNRLNWHEKAKAACRTQAKGAQGISASKDSE